MSLIFIFKQAVTFGNGLTYSLGQHRVPENVQKIPYFLDLQKAGLIVSATDGVTGPTVSQSQLDIKKKAIETQKAEGAKLSTAKVQVEAEAEKVSVKTQAPAQKSSSKK